MKLLLPLLISFALLCTQAQSQIRTTIATLRTGSVSTTSTYFVTDEGREGVFFYDAKEAGADNGGTIVVNAGRRFKRVYSGELNVRWFGMKGDYNGTSGTDNAAAYKAAIAAAKKDEVIMVPARQLLCEQQHRNAKGANQKSKLRYLR